MTYARRSIVNIRAGNPRPRTAEMVMCNGCGETWKTKPDRCVKCGGSAWERVGARGKPKIIR